MTTSTAPWPDELRRKGRPVDPTFQPEEDLYLRFQHLSGSHVDATDIRCPDQSFNRSKHCVKPECVLLPTYADWGIGSLKVKLVPAHLAGGGGAQSFFRVEHVPEEVNYSHTEVRAYHDCKHEQRQKRVSRKVEQEFRALLSQQSVVLKDPAVASQGPGG